MGEAASSGAARVVTVALRPAMLAEVDGIADREGVSRSEAIRRLLEQALEEEAEDQALAEAAEAAYHDPANQERIPWARVKAELGL